MHIGFNFFNKSNKGEIIYNTKIKENFENKAYLISEKEEVHFNEIKQINVIQRNIIFSDKDIDKDKTQNKENKENKIIISMGSEDRRLIFWEMNNLTKK